MLTTYGVLKKIDTLIFSDILNGSDGFEVIGISVPLCLENFFRYEMSKCYSLHKYFFEKAEEKQRDDF